jgi:hypothetical protein
MDWSPILTVVVALGAWIVLVRFVLPRFGIKGG